MICTTCPRRCRVDRVSGRGFCGAPEEPVVSAVCRHTGEEPPVSGRRGICNVFFAHCNLQCVFCQNYEISRPLVPSEAVNYRSFDALVEAVVALLPQCENMLGLVSPSHYAYLVPRLVEAVHAHGLHPTVVYNTNAYDDVDILKSLEPYVDIYLPDFKYSDPDLAARLSHTPDYPQRAEAALKEMFRQKGSALLTDDDGLAFGGIIVRHLVLPGFIDNSLRCLDWLADNLSLKLHISLMSQYFPPKILLENPAASYLSADDIQRLSRTLTSDEYQVVADHLHSLGFSRGWTQAPEASASYRPDFFSDQPFK